MRQVPATLASTDQIWPEWNSSRYTARYDATHTVEGGDEQLMGRA